MEAREIARRFGLGAAGSARLSDRPVASGKQGHVWRLSSPGGRWAVKVPFHPSNEDDVRATAVFQEAACAAGVPAPRIVRTVEGDVLATVSGRQVRLYEWIDLLPPSLDLDPAVVGRVVASIHRVRVDGPLQPVDPWYQAPIGAEGWDRLVHRLFEAQAPFAADLAALRDELVALESWLEPPDTVAMCHRDLWADNLRPTLDGGVCVIDWENSGAGDPGHELACALFEFGRGDAGRARSLMGAYRDAGGPAEVSRPGHFTMLIAQLGHIAEIAANDWLDPAARGRDRAESAAWIGELLADPHSRHGLQRLLDAIGV
ncbi:MAG TPA: phosphotransferase [Candidatus Limnocylindrales bacterium]|nr:phosphotransferase [Candidatus Limnocylindrales bacterium]